jgi:hypothetical protein
MKQRETPQLGQSNESEFCILSPHDKLLLKAMKSFFEQIMISTKNVQGINDHSRVRDFFRYNNDEYDIHETIQLFLKIIKGMSAQRQLYVSTFLYADTVPKFPEICTQNTYDINECFCLFEMISSISSHDENVELLNAMTDCIQMIEVYSCKSFHARLLYIKTMMRVISDNLKKYNDKERNNAIQCLERLKKMIISSFRFYVFATRYEVIYYIIVSNSIDQKDKEWKELIVEEQLWLFRLNDIVNETDFFNLEKRDIFLEAKSRFLRCLSLYVILLLSSDIASAWQSQEITLRIDRYDCCSMVHRLSALCAELSLSTACPPGGK